MSDTLEVKIGASDAGLEATLKMVQGELAKMESKVRSGDLSMAELEQTMKRVAQVQGLEQKLHAIGTEAASSSPKVDALGTDLQKMADRGAPSAEKTGKSLSGIGLAAGVAGVAVKAGMFIAESAMKAASAVAEGFGQAIELGGQLTDLSSRTGETAGNLLILQRAFTNTGVGADAVGTAINKLQKFMVDAADGGTTQTQAMATLGVSLSELQGKTPTEQMGIFANALSGIQDPAQRAELAMTVFGKSGGELLPVLSNFSGELGDARNQLGSLPDVMNKSAKSFDALGDNMAAIGTKITEFAAGFIDQALPALNAFVDALSGVDAAGWGEAAMTTILKIADTLIGAFKDPLGAIEAWGLASENMWRMLGNGLLNGAMTFIDFLGNAFATNLPSAIGAYISSAFVDSALTFDRYLIEALMTFSSGLSTLPGLEGVGQKILSQLSGVNDGIIAQQLENMGKTKEAAAQVVSRFSEAAEKTNIFKEDFFNVADSSARMKAKFDSLEASGKETRVNFESSAKESDKIDKNISNSAKNSSDGMNYFITSANNSGIIYDKLKDSVDFAAKIATSFYNAEQSTIGTQSELKKAAQEMTQDQYIKGVKAVRKELGYMGGDFAEIGKSTRNLPDLARALGLVTEGKSPKQLLIEVQQEIEKIKKTPVEIEVKFNKNAFNNWANDIIDQNKNWQPEVSLRVNAEESWTDQKTKLTATDPIKLNFDGSVAIEDVKSSAQDAFKNPITFTATGDASLEAQVQKWSEGFSNIPFNLNVEPAQIKLDGLAPPASDFSLNTDAAETKISLLGSDQTISLYADTTSAQQSISNIDTSATLQTNADTTNAQNSIANISDKPISLTLNNLDVSVNTDAAQTKIAKLSEPINVNVDANQVQAAVGSMQAEITNSFSGGQGGDGGIGGQGGQGGAGGNAEFSQDTMIEAIMNGVNDIKNFVDSLVKKLPVPALA